MKIPIKFNRAGKHRVAFSLLELLVVISIIIILAGLLMSAFHRVRRENSNAAAKGMIHTIQIALERYNTEYGHWPLDASKAPPSTPPGSLTPLQLQWMHHMLSGGDVFLDGSPGGNPKQLRFLETSAKYVKVVAGYTNIVDPWQHPYQVSFDADANRSVAVYGNNALNVEADFCIWSKGVDGQDSAKETDPFKPTVDVNVDNITSWQ